jgi:hypothetical protein
VKLSVSLFALVLACTAERAPATPWAAPRVAPDPKPSPQPWPKRRFALVAEYQRLSPATQDERDAAEQQALSAPPEAAPDPMLLWALDEERNSGTLLLTWCRDQVNFREPAPLESCQLDSLGNGAVLLLTLVTECGGDSCSTEGYVLNASLHTFTRVTHNIGAGAEASPLGDALFVTSITNAALPGAPEEERRDAFGGQAPLILERISLPSMRSEPFAPCFSPKLSPKGRWLVCRDLAANVLKVPLTGGTPTRIASSGLAEGEAYFVWYAYIWPQAVEFVSESVLRFNVVRADGASFQHDVPWEE